MSKDLNHGKAHLVASTCGVNIVYQVPVVFCAAYPQSIPQILAISDLKVGFRKQNITLLSVFFLNCGLKNLKLPLDSSAVTAQSQAVKYALRVLIGLKTGRAFRWLNVSIKWAYSRHNIRK